MRKLVFERQNSISIKNIELIVFHEGLPGNEYRGYWQGRGSCGLVTAISGSATYYFKDGTERKIECGEAALFSNKVAYIVKNDGDDKFEHYVINFSLIKDSMLDLDVVIKPINFVNFTHKCEEILKFWRSGEPTANLRCVAILYELIADILENSIADSIGIKNYKMVLPAIHFIDENYATEITLDYLAKLCVMSKTNFRRVFTAVCGVSPIQYLLNVRLKRAKELLLQTNQPVREIALLCGFNDTEYFCRVYKKKTGITPGQTRNV